MYPSNLSSCTYPIYIKQSHNGGCNVGTDKNQCDDKSPPYVVNPNGGTVSIPLFNEIPLGTSVKIAKVTNMAKITQFEYTPTKDLMFWDLSDIDGAGPARAGSPFFDQNIRAVPVGKGVGVNTCKPITCKKNQVCKESYQFPDQVATKVRLFTEKLKFMRANTTQSCPPTVTTWQMDFCVPDAQFTRRDVGFAAVGFTA